MGGPLRSLRSSLKLRLLSLPTVHRWRQSRARRGVATASSVPQPDLVFVTPPGSAQGWILDAICREVGTRLPDLSIAYCRDGEALPRARRYFFSHYMYFVGALVRQPHALLGRTHVFATHLEPEKHAIDDRLLGRLLACSDGVVCMNQGLRDTLAALGVPADRLGIAVGAASREVYRPHARRADGAVGFCSAYYERKSPERLFEIVSALPHRHCVLLGRGWQRYPRFDALRALPNFEYIETSYEHYAAHYARMSVFVSVSSLEGGPIPLLEAMMSNAVPVASRTGFAPDLIEHGRNGFLFDVGAPASTICALVEQAYALDTDVSASAAHGDWSDYTARLRLLLDLPAPGRPATA